MKQRFSNLIVPALLLAALVFVGYRSVTAPAGSCPLSSVFGGYCADEGPDGSGQTGDQK